MESRFRCTCPITSALDILGDKWMLVLVKQMLMEGRQTFKDFLAADEAIATNILSAKLKLLEEAHLVTKSKLPNNKKTNIYRLTEKGIALAPVIVELAAWSDGNLRDVHPNLMNDESTALMRRDKAGLARICRRLIVKEMRHEPYVFEPHRHRGHIEEKTKSPNI